MQVLHFFLHVHTCRLFFSKLQEIRILKFSCFKTCKQLMIISVIFSYSSCLLAHQLFIALDACNSDQQINIPGLRKKIIFCISIMMYLYSTTYNFSSLYPQFWLSDLKLKEQITVLHCRSCDKSKKTKQQRTRVIMIRTSLIFFALHINELAILLFYSSEIRQLESRLLIIMICMNTTRMNVL